MSGSTFGKNFTLTTFGESHGAAIGAIIDGCPSNIALTQKDIMKFMNRRKPGNSKVATSRKEDDEVEILSGVFEGRTTGTPIALMIRNTDQRSRNYDNIKDVFRPSHADYTYHMKYGIRDYRGGGRSSARETAARVAGGSIAIKFLQELGIQITAFTRAIGDIQVDDASIDFSHICMNPLSMPNNDLADKAITLIESLKKQQDSIGGIVECHITGVPVGIGDPVFDKLDAALGHAMMGINAVKGFEIGAGFDAANMKASQYNDIFIRNDHGEVTTNTNHSGGILGGISTGNTISFKTYFKPTPSISKAQSTLDTNCNPVEITIEGRHDPVVIPRAVVVVECMAALVVADLLLSHTHSSIDHVKRALNLSTSSSAK